MRLRANKPQLRALLRKYKESASGASSFLAFRRSAIFGFQGECLMVPWCGMWLGIEKDGHCHS